MRQNIPTQVLTLAALVALARAAGATTIASAPLFSISAVNMQCEITNVSTTPVTILTAKILSDSAGDVTSFNDCVGLLAPGTACVLTSPNTNQNPHAVVTLKGGAKRLRGQCALFDGSSQTVSTPIQ